MKSYNQFVIDAYLAKDEINENIVRLATRVIQGVARTSPHVYGKAVNAIKNTAASRLIPDMNVAPGVVRRTGQGMGIRPIKPAGPKPPLDPTKRYQLLPNTKYGDLVMATPGGVPPATKSTAPKPSLDLLANPMGARASSTEVALNTLKRNRRGRVVR